MRMGRVSVQVLTALACLVVALGGCGGGGVEKEPEDEAIPPYPAGLSSQSSPSQVAEVLIQALDGGNDEVLRGLVAVKHEIAAVDGIYSKYGRDHDTPPAEAIGLTVAGWNMSYAWYQPGATRVSWEQIDGDNAVVGAQGVNPQTGRARELTIKLVREDGVWKVAAGLTGGDL